MTAPKATVSNRDLRRTASNHADVLEKFGACLDSQADAIKGLADNQRVLATALTEIERTRREDEARTVYQRLRWLLTGR